MNKLPSLPLTCLAVLCTAPQEVCFLIKDVRNFHLCFESCSNLLFYSIILFYKRIAIIFCWSQKPHIALQASRDEFICNFASPSNRSSLIVDKDSGKLTVLKFYFCFYVQCSYHQSSAVWYVEECGCKLHHLESVFFFQQHFQMAMGWSERTQKDPWTQRGQLVPRIRVKM